MRNIYVILSATPTIMGRLIRTFTRNSLNHVSISLTENWSEMYSFARYRMSNPLVGGFVREFPQRLSLGKDKNVYIEVYKIPVSEKQYNEIKLFIYNIRDDAEENIYNSIAAFGLLFQWQFKAYKTYMCSDFVVESLLAGNIRLENYKSKNILPNEFRKMVNKYICFSGCMSDYAKVSSNSFYDEDFFKKTGLSQEFLRTFYHFYNLYNRRLTECK